MIVADAWQLRSRSTGGFVKILIQSPGFAAGEAPPPTEQWLELVPSSRFGDYWRGAHVQRALAEKRLFADPNEYEAVRAPACACCGDVPQNVINGRWQIALMSFGSGNGRNWRCAKHLGRNPCAIEGCSRTRAVGEDRQHATDQWMCSDHWRRFVPPRSMRRRAYHAFFRRAKRHGWSDELTAQFWRFWDSLVASARRRAAGGHLDIAEIERMFG